MFRKNTLVCIVILACTCVSCVTRRYTALPSSPPPAAVERARILSLKLGLPVTAEDYLPLYGMVSEWLGTPHRMGQRSRKGTDCSGFVTVVYGNIYGKALARSSSAMLRQNCRPVKEQAKLREGDLVFFHTGRNTKIPSHVGIYLKDRKFVHSSTSHGVIISSLDEPYYAKRWISGGIVK
ncbi:MAG: C40 family peptidase [Tannerella sp.]|jgi:cell wall-associated NlpC family hydrolase|nr:C40 family peptidase [Tannerella sp.]